MGTTDGLADVLNQLSDGSARQLTGKIELRHPLFSSGRDFEYKGTFVLSSKGGELYVTTPDGQHLTWFRPNQQWQGEDGNAHTDAGTYMTWSIPNGWVRQTAVALVYTNGK